MKFKEYYKRADSERREMSRAFDAQDDMLRRQTETIRAQEKLIAHMTRALLKVKRGSRWYLLIAQH